MHLFLRSPSPEDQLAPDVTGRVMSPDLITIRTPTFSLEPYKQKMKKKRHSLSITPDLHRE